MTGISGCRSSGVPPEDLRELLADKMFSWKDLREKCREEATRPVIKHCEQSSLQKAHNARIDDDIYNQRSMSETVFSMLKADGGENLHTRTWHGQFRELTRKCIVHNCRRRSANAAACSFSARIEESHRQRLIRRVTDSYRICQD